MNIAQNFSDQWTTAAITKGWAHVYFAFDIGFWINLDEADRLIVAEKERTRIQSKKRMSKYFHMAPLPIRITRGCEPMELAGGQFKTKDVIEALLFDFGSVSVGFKIPLPGKNLQNLLELSEALFDNTALKSHARQVVGQILQDIAPAVTKPNIADAVEDYVIFQVEEFSPTLHVERVVGDFADALACILRAEKAPLSAEEVDDVRAHRISYGRADVTFVDWNSSFIYGKDAEDLCAVLEYANVALLEFSHLDRQLDAALEQFYQYLTPKKTGLLGWPLRSRKPALRKIGQFQIDSALLFESVTNTLKLFDDIFLVRLYHITTKRFGLGAWDTSINRKLNTVESIYRKIYDAESTRRMEILEWVIILLIAVSIWVSFLPGHN
jgi:hypothetical protein